MSDKNTDESLLKTWAEAQQKLLTDWLDTLRKLGGTPTLELWTKTVDTWQASVKETVDARAEFSRQFLLVLDLRPAYTGSRVRPHAPYRADGRQCPIAVPA